MIVFIPLQFFVRWCVVEEGYIIARACVMPAELKSRSLFFFSFFFPLSLPSISLGDLAMERIKAKKAQSQKVNYTPPKKKREAKKREREPREL